MNRTQIYMILFISFVQLNVVAAFVSPRGIASRQGTAKMISSNIRRLVSFDSRHATEPFTIVSSINGIQWLAMPSFAMAAIDDSTAASAADATIAVAGTETLFALSPTQTILVFVIGVIPFAVATIEFWRRIAFGESFGTGSDSVIIIGEDDAPESSRGQRVLGKGALAVAYGLFAVAAAVLGLVLCAVVTS